MLAILMLPVYCVASAEINVFVEDSGMCALLTFIL